MKVTYRRKMEIDLPIAANLNQTLEEYSIVAITNRQGKIIHANDNFCKISQYSREELIGEDHRIINSDTHPKSFFEEMWKTITSGQVWNGEIRNKAKDGSFYWVDTHIIPFHNENNEITEFIAIRVDITEKKLAEEKSLMQQEQLQQADRLASIGIMTTGVAHEINNPNQLILSNAETMMLLCKETFSLLEDNIEDTESLSIGGLPFSELKNEIPEILSRIREGSIRIKKIVANLKNYARKEELEDKTQVNLNIVVKSALILAEPWIKKSTNHFEMELHEDLPTFSGYFHQIEQVIINLITNACQAIENREQVLLIKTYSLPSSEQIAIEIIDQGKGMTEEELKRIFDPFFTTNRDKGGTGLGLYISHSIIQKHFGQLSFHSEVGKGTTAKLLLPTKDY